MMKPKNQVVSIISLLLLLFLSSCIAFRANNLPPIPQWPLELTKQGKSISIIVSGKLFENGKEVDTSPKKLERWHENTVKTYRESGLFSGVRRDLVETDLRTEVKIVEQRSVNSGLDALCTLFLLLIPTKRTSLLTVNTTFKDVEGNILCAFEKSESMNYWIQLFLIFVSPIIAPDNFQALFSKEYFILNFPDSYAIEIIKDLNRATISEAQAQGII